MDLYDVQTPVGIEHRLLSSVSRVRAVDIGGAISRFVAFERQRQTWVSAGRSDLGPDIRTHSYPIGIFKPQRVHLRVVPRMTTIPLYHFK